MSLDYEVILRPQMDPCPGGVSFSFLWFSFFFPFFPCLVNRYPKRFEKKKKETAKGQETAGVGNMLSYSE